MELIHQIFNHLKEHNVNVYYPFVEQKDVKQNFVVVKDTKQIAYERTIVKPRCELLCYAREYQDLLSYKEQIQHIMELANKTKMIKPEYNDSIIIYDESCKGYMVSFGYYSYKTIKKE